MFPSTGFKGHLGDKEYWRCTPKPTALAAASVFMAAPTKHLA